MDNDSGDENQAQDGEDDDLSPERLLVDECFQEIVQKSTTVRTLCHLNGSFFFASWPTKLNHDFLGVFPDN